MKNLVICGLVAASLFVATGASLAAPTSVTSLSGLEQLQTQLNSSSRLYVVGNPDGVDEYRKIVDANPDLVVVVMEKSVNPEADVQAVMNVLNNFDVVRTQMVDDWLGAPEGFLAVRIDTNTSKTRPDGSHPGYTGVTVTEGQRMVGFTDKDLWELYTKQRDRGLSVPNAINGAIGQARTQVSDSITAMIKGVDSKSNRVRGDIEALKAEISATGFTPEGFSQTRVANWEERLNRASRSTSSIRQVTASNQAVEAVAQEVAVASGNLDKFVTAGRSIQEVRNGIKLLKQAIEQANFQPDGYSTAKVNQWNESLDSALGLLQNGNLSQAQQGIGQVDREVAQMLGQVKDVVSTRQNIRNLIQAIVLLSAIALGVSIFVTKRARKDAEKLANEIRQELGELTSEALALSENSAYVAIGARGLQEDKAEELNSLNLQLLKQTGVLSKYLKKCDQVLDAKGLAALAHFLTPFGVMYVKAVSTGKKAITLSADELRALTADSGEKLQTLAAELDFVTDDVNLTEVRETYTETFEQAQALYKLLKDSESNLAKGILDVKTGLVAFEESLAEVGSPKYFSSAAYEVGVVGPISNPDGGLIAIAEQKQSQNDYLGGIVDGTDKAARVLLDGQKALEATVYGGSTLVPQGNSAVAALGAEGSGLETDWIFTEIANLSIQLDAIIQSNSFSGSIAGLVAAHRRKLEDAVQKLVDAERLNELRISVWPVDLSQREELVAASESTVLQGLKALGFYEDGDVDGVYREEGSSPKALIALFTDALHDLVGLLGQGQVQESLAIEQSILGWKTRIEVLVEKTEERLGAYSGAVAKIDADVQTGNSRYDNLNNPEVTSSQFSVHSQQMAMSEAGASSATLLDTLNSAGQLIASGVNGRQQADSLMNSAAILAAGKCVDEAQASVDSANALLLAIPVALQNLAQAVSSAGVEVAAAIVRYKSSTRSLDYKGVRTATRQTANQMAAGLNEVQSSFHIKPYEALAALADSSDAVAELERQIADDLDTYAQIVSLLDSAAREVDDATSAIATAQGHTFTHSTVDTSRARGYVNSYNSNRAAALASLASEDYVSALSQAQSAYSAITSVPAAAHNAVTAAEQANAEESARLAAIHEAQESADSISYTGGSDSSYDTSWSGGDD